jgi:hypothetical protein
MANVEVFYGGRYFTIAHRTIDDVQAEISGILMSGEPGWIKAYDGHGRTAPTHLLVTAGAPLSLVQTPEFDAG